VNSLGDDDLPTDADLHGQRGAIRPRLCFHIFVFYGFQTQSQEAIYLIVEARIEMYCWD
jgi:hypothetical protein